MKRTNDTKIGCLGEVMLELIPDTGDAARLGIAGDTYNTAVYLARADIAVDYITVLGHDGFSDRISRRCRSSRSVCGLRRDARCAQAWRGRADWA